MSNVLTVKMSITELIPHAPQVGLFVVPNIPHDKLSNALGDYAAMIDEDDVLALFDATLMGSAKDGAVFTQDRLVFQNNDLQPSHEIRYEDIVHVDARRKLLGGRRLLITVNRGRATFEIEMDFSGKPKAADFVLRFLREAMLRVDVWAANSTAQSGKTAPTIRSGPSEKNRYGESVSSDRRRGEGTSEIGSRAAGTTDIGTDAEGPTNIGTGAAGTTDIDTDAEGPTDIDTDAEGPTNIDTDAEGPTDISTDAEGPSDIRPRTGGSFGADNLAESTTDTEAVSRALVKLRDEGRLSALDFEAMIRLLNR